MKLENSLTNPVMVVFVDLLLDSVEGPVQAGVALDAPDDSDAVSERFKVLPGGVC